MWLGRDTVVTQRSYLDVFWYTPAQFWWSVDKYINFCQRRSWWSLGHKRLCHAITKHCKTATGNTSSWGGAGQSILKEINPEYSLEGLILKLKIQYFHHLMWRANSLEKTLMLGEIEGRRRRENRGQDSWMASLTQWIWIWASSRSWWWTGKPGMPQSMGSQRVGHDLVTELRGNRDIKKKKEKWIMVNKICSNNNIKCY